MKITGFEISDFKGIRNAEIKFSDNDDARVHTLVGLNESGKTTLLEAIHSFSPDAETQLVVKNAKTINEQREQWIPRDKISNFTGKVSRSASIEVEEDDLEILCKNLKIEGLDVTISNESFPNNFKLKLEHIYENANFIESKFITNISDLKIKSKRGKNFRSVKEDEMDLINNEIRFLLPSVAYYPTFIFDFPDKVYLTDKDNSPRNKFYKQLFQDILDYDGSGYTIDQHILSRTHKEDLLDFWSGWFSAFVGSTDEDKIKQVIARAEIAVTKLIIQKWNEVFGEDSGSKEISIEIGYEEGILVKNEQGLEEKAKSHDVYIKFRIKDGSNIYSVDDRSLGFRWFFSFLLFTQFRIYREKQNPTIFLFDEPASNLHAAAQQQLLASFPKIAESPHRLIYSTHSHYMVNPSWLEQAYIIYDKSSKPDDSIIDSSIRDDSFVDIHAVPYRNFVNENPSLTSYFQPILDTLEVKPSSFDYSVGGLIVEGKSDYYIIEYCSMHTGIEMPPIFPAQGSGTMGALVSLHIGWGLPVKILFDTDRGGRDGRKNLVKKFSLNEDQYTDLKKLIDGIPVIENIFSEKDIQKIIGNRTSKFKTQLLRKVQEALASNKKLPLEGKTTRLMKKALTSINTFITS